MLRYLLKFFSARCASAPFLFLWRFGLSRAETLLLEILTWLAAGTRLKPRMVKERQTEGCLLNDITLP